MRLARRRVTRDTVWGASARTIAGAASPLAAAWQRITKNATMASHTEGIRTMSIGWLSLCNDRSALLSEDAAIGLNFPPPNRTRRRAPRRVGAPLAPGVPLRAADR